ncbi:two component transcriptional regulator, LytTR family [Sphaerochaeta associata]|jgi:DNA-binding LytR/AlgR family response regulator|uniref:LytTR family DNA-binding domain-containing protein n=1 Tax=Sphaerochaeta associata TaxID=1129264 RepID=A0ABY4D883_9SPIR|nr:LytTR family DNA-binding domain-containing protein [Sphaerochaeta associata]NLE14383.1 response regulator transcription factor [Spirochaetales bacterium]UOM50506.1 LytTR family DNA-binding domain-containing protein [Sphaerochaeta associata]SMP40802.1 two component transcriptional regulator, LytTR family [Sphaerochaeta associata]
MLDIAICDDDPTQLALLATYTNEWVQNSNNPAFVHQFLHPDELLRSCEKRRYHIYLLDIVMPMIHGIEVGKTIREHDQQAVIIYATSEPSFALQSFATNPINYLLKPIDKGRLHATLSLAASKLDPSDEHVLTVKTHAGIQVIRPSEILFCEYSKHTVIYTLTDGRTVRSKVIQGTFSRYIERTLHDKRFIRPHVSYVLNMDYVESFTKTRFTLRSEHNVPIVIKQYCTVRDIYMNYLSSKGKT